MSCFSCLCCSTKEPPTPPPTPRAYSASENKIDQVARVIVRSREVDDNLVRHNARPPHRKITLIKEEAERIKKDIDTDEKLHHHRRLASRII